MTTDRKSDRKWQLRPLDLSPSQVLFLIALLFDRWNSGADDAREAAISAMCDLSTLLHWAFQKREAAKLVRALLAYDAAREAYRR